MQLKATSVAIVSALAIVFGACGGGTPAATPAPATAAPATAAAATAKVDPFLAQWNTLIEAAKKEGQLNIVGGPEGSQQDGAWYDAFGKQFGIKVVLSGGNAAEVSTRTLAERAQGVYTLDISGQGGTGTQRFLDAKVMDPLTPQIFHPEALDRSKGWFIKDTIWSDATHEFCQYVALEAEANIGEFYYNTAKVSQAEIDSVKSWKDLLDPKWKGRIVIGDIASGEAAQDRTRLWLLAGGEKFFDPLLRVQAAKVVAYGDERTYADGVARGDYQIAIFPPGTASLDKAIQSKLPVARLERTLAEGAPHNGVQRICLMNKAPHPNAAKLFINWTMTKEGQTALNAFTGRDGRLALRNDVPQGKVKTEVWQRSQKIPFIFLDTGTTEFANARKAGDTYLKGLFAELKIVPGK